MDHNALRDEYNKSYLEPLDRWSCHDVDEARTIVSEIINQIRTYGLVLENSLKSLDVGCAKGHISEALRLEGFISYGLDYSDVAIQKAKTLFPKCCFSHMNGFEPNYTQNFDLILARGFSGCNTHDIDFVANFSNKYINLLKRSGFYVLAFTSDFSGRESPGETVCWSKEEIEILVKKIQANYNHMFFIPPRNFLSEIKRLIKFIIGRKHKFYFYLIFQKK